MNLQQEFHLYLDREWPLWKDHESGRLYHMLWKAFQAGFKVRDVGATPPTDGDPYWYGLDWNPH
jgi:hypothetical protein